MANEGQKVMTIAEIAEYAVKMKKEAEERLKSEEFMEEASKEEIQLEKDRVKAAKEALELFKLLNN